MGKFLDRIVNVWGDLESSYANSGNGKTRKEFLLSLAGSKDGSFHKLDMIKSAVMKEYNDDPENANNLSIALDLLARNWKRLLAVDEIENLDIFMLNLSQSASVTTASTDPYEFVKGLDPYEFSKPKYIGFDELIISTGFLSDVFKQNKQGQVTSYKVPNYVKGQEIFLFKGGDSLEKFALLNKEGDPFIQTVFAPIAKLFKGREVEDYMFVVGRDNFYKRLDTVTIVFDQEKIQATLKNTLQLEGKRVMECSYQNGYFEYTFFCVS